MTQPYLSRSSTASTPRTSSMSTPAPWLRHYDVDVPASLKPYPERTLLDYLRETASEHGSRSAAIFKGRSLTYAALAQATDAFAAALVAFGVRPGDRVALALPNAPQFLIAEIGAWKAGAIVSPVNPLYTDREMEEALVTSGAETVVVLNRFYGKVKALQARTSIKRVITTNIKEYLPPILALAFTLLKERKEGDRISLQPGDHRLQDLLSRHAKATAPDVVVRPEDPALILMSGGTTGTPKGVVGSHHGVVITGLQLQAWLRSTLKEWKDAILLPLPLFHAYANCGVQAVAIVNHNPLVLVPNARDIGDVLTTIKRTKPAFICAVPTLLTAIMNHPRTRAGKVSFRSIKLCFCGAAALMAETKRRWEEMTGGVILEGYSLTEAQMAVVLNPARGEKKIGSVGMPLPDVTIRIVDDDGKQLPTREVGEIVMGAPQLMRGYWQREDETREMLRTGPSGEPLLYTGDLGYLDRDGYLFIVDRKKDLIKTSGFQVWPREVEEVIATHPAVAECGVAGLPDAEKGEIVKAWVVLSPGKTVSEEELRTFCREKMVAYKAPARWEFVPDLPKTMVGKVLRRALRQRDLVPVKPV